MDKTARVLLSVGIGILFPLVVFFSVMTIIPSKEPAEYPRYPSCSESTYDRNLGRYTDNDNCKTEMAQYEAAQKDYEQSQKDDEKLDVVRGQVALAIAVLTIVGVLFLKDQKEITGGLVFGSSLVVIGAISTMLSGYENDQMTDMLNSILAILTFLVLTGVIYFTDQAFPATDKDHGHKHPTPPPAPLGHIASASPAVEAPVENVAPAQEKAPETLPSVQANDKPDSQDNPESKDN